MAKYHINPKNGEVTACRAKIKCRFSVDGQNEPPHFETKKEALDFSEQENASQYETFNTMTSEDQSLESIFEEALKKKNPSRVEKMELQVAYMKRKREELEENYRNNPVPINHEYEALSSHHDTIKEYNKDYADLEKNLSQDEKDAMKSYTAITYEPINNLLNNPEKHKQDSNNPEKYDKIVDRLNNIISNVDSFIAKSPKKDRQLYRVIEQDTTTEFTSSEEFLKNLGYEEGKEVHFKSYSSTTIDPGCAAHRVGEDEHTAVLFVINTDEGAPVDQTVENVSESRFTQDLEREILIPRNSSYRVSRIERTRLHERDGGIREPLTVFLDKIESTEKTEKNE